MSTIIESNAGIERAYAHARNESLFAAVVNWLGTTIRNRFIAWRRRSEANAIHTALYALDARTLRDLGFDRSEIASVAAEVSGQADHTRRVLRAPPR